MSSVKVSLAARVRRVGISLPHGPASGEKTYQSSPVIGITTNCVTLFPRIEGNNATDLHSIISEFKILETIDALVYEFLH